MLAFQQQMLFPVFRPEALACLRAAKWIGYLPKDAGRAIPVAGQLALREASGL
jgi:hypothetical protein